MFDVALSTPPFFFHYSLSEAKNMLSDWWLLMHKSKSQCVIGQNTCQSLVWRLEYNVMTNIRLKAENGKVLFSELGGGACHIY